MDITYKGLYCTDAANVIVILIGLALEYSIRPDGPACSLTGYKAIQR